MIYKSNDLHYKLLCCMDSEQLSRYSIRRLNIDMKFTKTQNKNDAKLDPTLIARYLHGGNSYYGQVRGDEIFQVNGDIFGNWETTNISQPLKAVKLLAPVEPKRIVAIGVNSEVYRAFRRGDVLETDANNDVYDSDR